MFWCTRAWAKLNVQLFCAWRSQGRRKGDQNINVVGNNKKQMDYSTKSESSMWGRSSFPCGGALFPTTASFPTIWKKTGSRHAILATCVEFRKLLVRFGSFRCVGRPVPVPPVRFHFLERSCFLVGRSVPVPPSSGSEFPGARDSVRAGAR